MNRVEQIWKNGPDNYILPFLWMHGASDERKRKMVEVIYESGAKAVCVEARPHPDFAGHLWWHDVEVILEEAKKREMKVWILDDAHFPTGLANGAAEHAPEHLKRICLEEQHIDILGPVSGVTVNIEERLNRNPETDECMPEYYKEKVVEVLLAEVETKEEQEVLKNVICLTEQIKNGTVTLSVPKGVYRVFIITRKIHASKFLSDAISFLEPESVDLLIKAVYETHYEHFSKWFGNTIAGFFSDEPGFFNLRDRGYGDVFRTGTDSEPLPWTDQLYEQLKDKFPTDARMCLPYLFGSESEKAGEDRAFRSLYMDLVTKTYEENFPAKLSKWCAQHKVEYIGHVVEDIPSYERLGQGVGHYFRAIRQQDMAGIDVVLNSLLPEKEDFYLYGLPQLAASCAAHSKKQKGRALCELFGAYGWSEGVSFMKWMADFMLLHGINVFVPHAFTDSAFPDEDCPPHFWAEGNNPQFPAIGQLFNYMNRMAELLSKSTPIVKNAVLFEAESDWAGDTAPYCEIGKELITHQMEYHLVCMDDLRNIECKEGQICLGNQKYSRLFLSKAKFMSKENAAILDKLQKQGISICFTDSRPLSLEGEVLSELSEIPVVSISEVAEQAERSLITLEGKSKKWVHCSSFRNEREVFHVLLNTSMKESVEVKMAVQSILNEKSGMIRVDMMKQCYQEQAGFEQKLLLEPGELVILMEVPEEDIPSSVSFQKIKKWKVLPIDTWKLSLSAYDHPEEWEEQGEIKQLKDLYEAYPDFAGKVRYETTIDLDHAEELWLRGATEAVSVWADDEPLGRCIGTPYRYTLPCKKTGKAVLRVEVASTLYGAVKDGLSEARELPHLGFEGEIWAY